MDNISLDLDLTFPSVYLDVDLIFLEFSECGFISSFSKFSDVWFNLVTSHQSENFHSLMFKTGI